MTLNDWKIASELVEKIISSAPVLMGGAWAWWSYDVVAEIYDRLAVPHVLTQPAKDLVAMLKLPSGARALDVGAGTGLAALLALQSAGPGAPVVALDSSLGMLRLARKKGLPWLVAGTFPAFPSPTQSLMASWRTSFSPTFRLTRRRCWTWPACCGPEAGWGSARGAQARATKRRASCSNASGMTGPRKPLYTRMVEPEADDDCVPPPAGEVSV